MRVAAVFPQLEIGSDPDEILRYARTVEDLGYDHLVAFDHVLGAHPDRPGGWEGRPYDHRSPFHEPFVLFGFLASAVRRLRFATAIIVLPQRQTGLVAKQAAEVDVLSGGRLVLGVGIGWNFVEFEALGTRFENRGRRIEEQIALLRRLFTEDVVDFSGRWHRVARAGLNPLPVQRPIPIWMGGGWDARGKKVIEPALRRIAALADGWFTHLPPDEDGRRGMETFRAMVRDAGRDPDRVPVEGRVTAARGEAADWVAGARAFKEMGLTSVELTTMGARFATLDDHLEALRRFREGLRGEGVG